jgi:hypothetical protein
MIEIAPFATFPLPSLEILFLGLTRDCHLKWNSHISNKIVAAKRAFFALSSGLKTTWGFDKSG